MRYEITLCSIINGHCYNPVIVNAESPIWAIGKYEHNNLIINSIIDHISIDNNTDIYKTNNMSYTVRKIPTLTLVSQPEDTDSEAPDFDGTTP